MKKGGIHLPAIKGVCKNWNSEYQECKWGKKSVRGTERKTSSHPGSSRKNDTAKFDIILGAGRKGHGGVMGGVLGGGKLVFALGWGNQT